MSSNQERQTAVKTRIGHLVSGKYVLKEGWEPNYVDVSGIQISRANVMGIVVGKNQNEFSDAPSLLVDDGSGRISVRAFEDKGIFEGIEVGDAVLIVGRPREYNNERFLVPEIIRAIENKKWIDVRKLELEKAGIPKIPETKKETEKEEEHEEKPTHGPDETRYGPQKISADMIQTAKKGEPSGQQFEGPEEEAVESSAESIISIIRELDKGEGAEMEGVVSRSKDNRAEQIVKGLLKNGDVFEIRPGRLKVLE